MSNHARAGGGRARANESSKRVGRYRLLELLGRGGMADVYKAERPVELAAGGPRLCVVKTIRSELAETPEFARMFADEIQVMRLLRHPNIVRTYDHGISGGSLFLAMELLAGLSLSRVVRALTREQQTLPVALAAHIAAEIALALDYAHAATDEQGNSLGLVHRDVSPSNVMLLRDGQVKLVDFGIAKLTAQISARSRMRRDLTNADVVKGKLNYMAPEQVLGQPIDARADLFALGTMLWELLVWRPLFARPTSQEIAAMVVHGEIPRPSSLRPDIPPALDSIVMRALERDPRRRQASAGELARELGPFGLPRGDLARALGQLVRALDSRRPTPTPGSPPRGLAAVRTPPASPRIPTPALPMRPRLPTPHGQVEPLPRLPTPLAPPHLPQLTHLSPLPPPTPFAGASEATRSRGAGLRQLVWTLVVAAAGFWAGVQWARNVDPVTGGNAPASQPAGRTNVIQPLDPPAEVQAR